jgi:hypothetical protein
MATGGTYGTEIPHTFEPRNDSQTGCRSRIFGVSRDQRQAVRASMDDLTRSMAGGARISSCGKALTFGFNSATPGAKRGFSRRQSNGTRAQKPLPGVPPDVKAMTKLLKEKFGMQVEEHLVGHGGDYEKMDKRTVVRLLTTLFNDQSTNKFVIYVAGHGDGEEGKGAPIGKGGNWVLDNYADPNDQRFKTVSLREIMTLWLALKKKRSDNPQLTICHDVCFGGTVSSR